MNAREARKMSDERSAVIYEETANKLLDLIREDIFNACQKGDRNVLSRFTKIDEPILDNIYSILKEDGYHVELTETLTSTTLSIHW